MAIKTLNVFVMSLNILVICSHGIRNFIVESYLCLIKLSVKNKLFSVEQQCALVSAKMSVPNGTQVLVIFNPRRIVTQCRPTVLEQKVFRSHNFKFRSIFGGHVNCNTNFYVQNNFQTIFLLKLTVFWDVRPYVSA